MAKEIITIGGRPFKVPNPYEEGHTINANEAAALNQVYHENIRNNLVKKLEGLSDTEAQTRVDEYAETYEFGVRVGGGGGSRDPVQTEAMAMVREAIKRALQKKGHSVSGKNAYPAKEITALAQQALARDPDKWYAAAREAVARKRDLASDILTEAAE